MNILSLFDGMSCGQQALERAGFKVDKYFSSEIDKFAIQVTQKNYPKTIQLGSVIDLDVSLLPKIDILIGGSPCQSFSFAGKRAGMSTKNQTEILTLDHYLELKKEKYEFEGQSYLFWEYIRVLNELKTINPNIKFILENVVMSKKWEKVLTKAIMVNPIKINSSLVSAQNRKRLYWSNIGMKKQGFFGDLVCGIKQPKDKGIFLKDVFVENIDEKYFLKESSIRSLLNWQQRNKENGNGFKIELRDETQKSAILTTGSQKSTSTYVQVEKDKSLHIKEGSKNGYVKILPGQCFDAQNQKSETRRGRLMDLKSNCLVSSQNDMIQYTKDFKLRRFTPIECERLQTVKDNYTDCVSDSQRYKMLGNGWTVDVIVHILKHLDHDSKN